MILADEPTGNLDSENGIRIIQLLEQIQRESGVTVIIVTHDEQMAQRADQTIQIRDGKIVGHHHRTEQRRGGRNEWTS